jgi:hypothetical protein
MTLRLQLMLVIILAAFALCHVVSAYKLGAVLHAEQSPLVTTFIGD